LWLTAEGAAQTGDNQLIVAVFIFLGVVVTALGSVVVALVNSRTDRTAPSPPSPSADWTHAGDVKHLQQDVAVLLYRADAKDEQLEVIDRRLDVIEQKLDPRPPGPSGQGNQ
jgi:hypothetical protein